MDGKKLTKVIIFNLAFIIFGLAGLASGTMAWFLTSTAFETRMESFSIVAPPSVDYNLFFLSHFDCDGQIKKGNFNSDAEEYSGYYNSFDEDAVFIEVEYDNEGNVVTDSLSYYGDPTDITSLWPAHRLTFAVLINEGTASSLSLTSFADSSEVLGTRALISPSLVQKITKGETEAAVTHYSLVCNDGKTFDFTLNETGEIECDVPNAPVIEVDDGYFYVDGEKTLIPTSTGGETETTVLAINKLHSLGNIDSYSIVYSNGEKCYFDFNTESEVAVAKPSHIPEIEISSDETWIIDSIDTGIGIEEEEATSSSCSVSIRRTSYDDESEVGTFEIVFSNGSTVSFNCDKDRNIRTNDPGTLPTVSLSKNDTWEIDGIDTLIQIADEIGDNLPTQDISLSWAIDIYGKAYADEIGNPSDSIASLYEDYAQESIKDVFSYSQRNPLPESENFEPIKIVGEGSPNGAVPEASGNQKTVIFFTIEFSNDEDTFYSFDESLNAFRKNIQGNSVCYEGLSLSNLGFALK